MCTINFMRRLTSAVDLPQFNRYLLIFASASVSTFFFPA